MTEESPKKNKALTIFLKILLYIAVVIITIIVVNYFTNDNTKETIDDLLGIDPDAGTERPEEDSNDTSETIAIPGFEKLTFQSDSLIQDVRFENPEDNDVYFIVSLNIADTMVYESQLIEPGTGIYSIELPNTYEPGEYEGTLSYRTRSMEDSNEQKNGAVINLQVIVE